jgi:hypothetical protein
MSYEREERDLLTIFKDGISQGLRVLNIRSKEAYDTLKIKNTIRHLERRRMEAVYDMGASVYRTFKHTGKVVEDTVAARCADIDRIESEIEGWNENLKLVHVNARKALGSVKALAKPRAAAFCDCGAEIPEGARYCGQCYKELN